MGERLPQGDGLGVFRAVRNVLAMYTVAAFIAVSGWAMSSGCGTGPRGWVDTVPEMTTSPAPSSWLERVAVTYQVEDSIAYSLGPDFGPVVFSLWYRETARRYPEPVVFIGGHGGDRGGEWVVVAEHTDPAEYLAVSRVVAEVRAEHPTTRIVLLVCNPGRYELAGHAGITYARDNLWMLPDRSLLIRNQVTPEYFGNIFEFDSLD